MQPSEMDRRVRQMFRPRTDKLGLTEAWLAEFLGVMLFQLLAGSSSNNLGVALTLAAILWGISWFGNGHLNPAVSLAAAASGYMSWLRMASYWVAQFGGALAGATLQVLLTPGLRFGKPVKPMCHVPAGLNGLMLYLWETLLAVVFVETVYAAIVYFHPNTNQPGHGSVGPLAVGAALYAVLTTGGILTNTPFVNPAVSFASSLTFMCKWRWAWVYMLAHFTAGGLVALAAIALFGRGPYYTGRHEEAAPQGYEGARESLLGHPGGVEEP